MNETQLKSILDDAANGSAEDREELADYARIIEARRAGLYRVPGRERDDLNEALGQADRGEFASDAMMADTAKRYGA